MKKQIVKLVHVQWEDAYVEIESRTSMSIKEVINRPGPLRDSCGFLIGLTPKKVTLAMTIDEDHFDDTLEIPRSIVRKMTTLNRIRGSFNWIEESKKA